MDALMKRRLVVLAGTFAACTASAQLPKLDDIMKGVEKLPKAPTAGSNIGASDDKTNAAGIKEALATGTERAVASVAQGRLLWQRSGEDPDAVEHPEGRRRGTHGGLPEAG